MLRGQVVENKNIWTKTNRGVIGRGPFVLCHEVAENQYYSIEDDRGVTDRKHFILNHLIH